MSNATAPSPMRSLLLAILMITSTMTAALTALPWMIDDARADPTMDGSDASDNSSSPSQATTFDMAVNGTLDSSDQEDWYYVELYSGDSVDFEANCLNSSCGTMMSFEPGTQGSMSYSLTTNSSDVNYSFTNVGSSVYNLTFGFENWALQSISTYVFEMSLTPGNTSGGNGSSNPGVYAYTYSTYYNSTDTVSGVVWTSNLSSGVNYSVTWSIYEYNTSQILGSNMTNSSFSVYYNDNFYFSNVSDGTYVLAADLWDADDSQWVASASSFFYVGNAGGTSSPGVSLTNWAIHTDGSYDYDTNYTTSDEIWGSVWTNNTSSGTNYSVTWLVYEYYTNTVVAMNLTNTSFNNYYSDSFEIASNMSVGYYSLTANLFNNDAGTLIDVASSFFAINNASGGSGGGGNGTWSAPTLSITITELVDHGTATNYSIEFNIDDMDYNSSYSWDFVLLNHTMDLVFSEFVESVSGNTSVTVEAPEVNQGGGIMLDDGCYVMAGFVHDETAQIEVEPVFDYLSVGGDSCTSVFVDVVDWPQQTGDPVMADLLFVDLDLYSNYTVYYQIKNDTSLLSSGNLTTYAESGMYNEVYNISSQGLAEGCYELHAELYDESGNLVQNAFSHVDTAYFEVGSPSCAASAGIDVWTNDYTYNAGDGVVVTIEAWDLDQDETYHVYWDLYNGGTYENGSSFSITNADWAENEFTIWDLWTDGCYYLQVELYDEWNNTLDWLGYEFEVGSGNCNPQQYYPWISVWSEIAPADVNISVDYELGDLELNHSYYIEWELIDMEHWNMVDDGTESLGTPNVESFISEIDLGELDDGCYWFAATLYDDMDNGTWMDSGDTEFYIGDVDCDPMSIYAQGGDFESGENVSFDIYMDNLDNNTNHTIRLELHKQRVGLDSTSEWDFTSDDEYMWTEWNLGQLEDGCYDIQMYLLSDDGDFARSGHGFRVGDVECAHPWVEMNSDRAMFEVEVNYFDMTFYDFPVNQSVDFDYEIWSWDSGYNDNGQFSHNITSWNETYSFNLGMLNDGCYEFNIHYNDEYGGQDYGAQFAVGSPTDEEGNVYRCWEAWLHVEPVDHRDHYTEEEIDFIIKVEGMHDELYTVTYQVCDYDIEDEDNCPLSGSFNASGSNGPDHSETITLDVLGYEWDRCLTLEVYLFNEENSWEIASNDWSFVMGDGDCWPPQVEVWAYGNEHHEMDSDVWWSLDMDIRAWDLDEGQEYNFQWYIYDEDGMIVDEGEENDMTWNQDLYYYYEINNLSDGCYDIEVYMYDLDWNLLSEDTEEKVGIGMETDCWAEPGVEFNYNWRGQIEFYVWDLRYNDSYLLSYEIYDNSDMSNIGGGSFEFVSDGGWEDFPVYVTLDAGEYWVEVTLSEAFGGDDIASSNGTIDVGDNSEEVWIEFYEANDNHHFGSGETVEFNVGMGNLDSEINYELSIQLVRHSDDGREVVEEQWDEVFENGNHEVAFGDISDDGYYDIEVQLHDSDTGEWIAGDNKGICVGDGCPTGENVHGDARLELTVFWPDRPADDDNDDCWRMEVQLIPEQRYLDDQDGNSVYGAYPDWSSDDWGDFTGNEFNFDFDGVPEGEYVVNVRVECSGEVDGEWTDYWGEADFDGLSTYFFSAENSTQAAVTLHTEVRDDGGGGDGGAWEFIEPYMQSNWVYRANVKEGPDGTELHVSMEISLSSDIVAALDSMINEGEGDGVISQDEMDMLMMMMMEEDEHDWDDDGDGGGDEFYWDGNALGAEEFQVEGQRIHGLVEGTSIYFVEFMVFSIDDLNHQGVLALFSDEEGEPLCMDDEMPDGWQVTFVIEGTDGWSVTPSLIGAPMEFTLQDEGHLTMTLTCDDTFPGQMQFDLVYSDDGTEPEPEPEPEVNSLPQCYIEWYRDGDDLTDSGMAILTAGDSVDDIVVTEGETITVYFNCWDDDGDALTLVVEPPFGEDATFNIAGNDGSQPSSMAKYIQLTVPTGFSGQFDFGAEWSDATAGGDFEFTVIVEPAADDNEEETEEESASAASFVPGFTGVLAMTALLGAVLVFALRREEE